MILVRLAAWLLICAPWHAACARGGHPFSIDPVVANRQASALLPRGTSEERVIQALQERGFEVSRLDRGSATGHLLVGRCTRNSHTWLVGVVIVDERALACSVTISEQP